MASIYRRKDSRFWWIKYRDKNNELHQESTHCLVGVLREKRRAQQVALEKSLEEHKHLGGQSRRGNWGWVDDFLKQRSAGLTLTRRKVIWTTIQIFLAEKDITAPTQLRRQHCFDYLTWRESPDEDRRSVRRSTVLHELAVLRVIMQEAVDRDLIAGNPCSRLKIRQPKPKAKPVLTPEDCAFIRAEIAKEKNDVRRDLLSNSFEIQRHQGCRISETRLNPQTDVVLNEDGTGLIRFRIKGDREHIAPLHPNLIALFTKLKADGRTSTWDGPPGSDARWIAQVWYGFFRRTGLKAKGISTHCNRVTVVTELFRANVPLAKAMSYVGHSSSGSHSIYRRVVPDDLRECFGAVGKKS